MSFKIIILSIIAVFLYSCSKDNDVIVTPGNTADTSTNFKYPYSLNSFWFFTTTPSYIFYPDSIRNYVDADTSIEIGYATWKNDTVIEGINARVLRTNHTSTTHAYNSTECYLQTDTGLVNLSYTLDYGASFGPFRPNPNVRFVYNGKTYYSNTELESELKKEFTVNSITELNNLNCVKYPIVTDYEWFFRNLSAFQTQRKKYLNYEQVQTPAGTYNCIKIQRKNYVGNPEILDSNYVSYDYFSKVGMIKRNYKFKNISFIYNGETIGHYDVGGEVILNSYSIAP